MTLFALLGVPAFLMVVYGLAVAPPPGRFHRSSNATAMPIPLVDFLKGIVYGVLGAVVGAVLQRFFSLSYRLFPMFLHYLVVDYLVVAGLAAAGAVGFCRKKTLLETIFFAGGFYTVVAIGNGLRSFGSYESYSLFLRPALHMATVLYLPLFLSAYQEWYGLRRVIYAVAAVGVPIVAAGIALLHRSFYEPWALAAAAVFVTGAAAVLYYSADR
jgi:hypothetical protein